MRFFVGLGREQGGGLVVHVARGLHDEAGCGEKGVRHQVDLAVFFDDAGADVVHGAERLVDAVVLELAALGRRGGRIAEFDAADHVFGVNGGQTRWYLYPMVPLWTTESEKRCLREEGGVPKTIQLLGTPTHRCL